MPQGLLDVIEEWKLALAAQGVVPSKDDPIICSLRRAPKEGSEVVLPLTPLGAGTVFKTVQAWLAVIGVTGSRCGAHRLRRSSATIAWEGHADLASIQTMLGHKDPKTTIASYIRPDDDLLRPASDAIDIDP